MPTLFDELKALLRQLETDKIEYALCGGFAHAIHGIPRATVDIDLLLRTSDWKQLQTAASKRGFSLPLETLRFRSGKIQIRRIFKIGEYREQIVINALLVTPTLRKIWLSREGLPWENEQLSVLSRDALIMLPRLSGKRNWPTSLAYLAFDEEAPSDVDMSSKAITTRLQRTSQLRDLCLSLGRAGESLRSSESAKKKPAPKPKK